MCYKQGFNSLPIKSSYYRLKYECFNKKALYRLSHKWPQIPSIKFCLARAVAKGRAYMRDVPLVKFSILTVDNVADAPVPVNEIWTEFF
jgi:hypothetical protein